MNDTTEWLIPKIEGVHLVFRPGDTVALQFPAGSEDVVLEILEEWVADLRAGGPPADSTEDDPRDIQFSQPDIDPRHPASRPAPVKRQITYQNHKPRSIGTTRGDTVSHEAQPASLPSSGPQYSQDPLALALGKSQGTRQGKPPAPKAPLPVRTRMVPQAVQRKGTVVRDQPKGVPLTQEQIEAWNKQQQEGQAIFQQLRQTRKPTDPQVTPEMAMTILRGRMEERGERYMETPDDTGERPEVETAQAPIVIAPVNRPYEESMPGATSEEARADMTANSRKTTESRQAPVVIDDVVHLPAEVVTPSGTVPLETIKAMVDPHKPTIKRAQAEALGKTEEPVAAKAPPAPLPKDAADRWAEQQHEWLGILRELKVKYEPGITVTKLMVDQEQKKRAAARGETLIPIAAPGSRDSILEQQRPVEAPPVGQASAAPETQLPLPGTGQPTTPVAPASVNGSNNPAVS